MKEYKECERLIELLNQSKQYELLGKMAEIFLKQVKIGIAIEVPAGKLKGIAITLGYAEFISKADAYKVFDELNRVID